MKETESWVGGQWAARQRENRGHGQGSERKERVSRSQKTAPGSGHEKQGNIMGHAIELKTEVPRKGKRGYAVSPPGKPQTDRNSLGACESLFSTTKKR